MRVGAPPLWAKALVAAGRELLRESREIMAQCMSGDPLRLPSAIEFAFRHKTGIFASIVQKTIGVAVSTHRETHPSVARTADGRFAVARDDIREIAPAALRHRLILNFEGQAEGVQADQVIDNVIETVAEPMVVG